MKKTIEITLDPCAPFFSQLQQNVFNNPETTKIMNMEVATHIVEATIETLKKELNTTDTKNLFNYSWEKKENIYPHFHSELQRNIDTALNKKIHRTALEMVAETVEKFMLESADRQAEKNKINVPEQINPDKELEGLTNLISQTWTGFDKFDAPEFFKQVWDKSNSLLANHFDEYIFNSFLMKLSRLRKSPDVLINNEINSSDLIMGLIISKSTLHDTIRKTWDYEKNVNSILSDIKKDFPLASAVKPHGWNSLAKNYSDFKGMENFEEAAVNKLFTGSRFETAGSHPFQVRTALPYVMYDDKCQGRKPLEVLVGAIIGHAFIMNEKNNGAKMLAEWSEFKSKLEEPGIKELYFEFKEPLNQAMIDIVKNDFEIKPSTLKIIGLDSSSKKIKP